MNTDVPSGLTPVDKAQASADVKSSQIQAKKKGDEAEDKNVLIPESDRVQFTQKSESTQSTTTHHLTTDKNLNEYINMLEQAAEIEDDFADESFTKNHLQTKTSQSNQKPDLMA